MHSNTTVRKASTLKRLALTSTTLVALALPHSAQADDWTGAISDSWFNPANWNSGQVPTAGDDVKIDNSAGSKPRISGNGNNAAADHFTVGDTNTANAAVRLSIENGGTLTSHGGVIGNLAGSNGIVIVDGSGSTWMSASAVLVGKAGTGALTISNGGFVNAIGGGILGFAPRGDGTLNVTGGSWTSTHAMNIGQDGKGTMTIANAGSVTDANGSIGLSAGSIGAVTVNGSGSKWTNSSSLTVGDAGTGTLNVFNGATVSNDEGVIGNLAGSIGTVKIDGTGSNWTNAGGLGVGYDGTGTLNVTNGGVVSSLRGFIGFNAGSTGTMTVDGAGSTWTNADFLQVGTNGTGALTISNGGKVTNTTADIGGGNGSGTVEVKGAGSNWTNAGDLTVGAGGTGTLDIAQGGAVSSNSGSIGFAGGSTGIVTVDGAGSKWTNDHDLTVGNAGVGQLNIQGGGVVTANNSTLGDANAAYGLVGVFGAGSAWNSTGDLIIGNNGKATVYLGGSATLDVGGTLTIAKNAGSEGELNIGGGSAAGNLNAATVQFGAGAGTLTFNHTNSNYAFGSAISGLGTLSQKGGYTNLTGDSSGFTGATNVTGGRLAVNGSLANSVVTVSGGGILGGNGTVGGIVVQNGGIAGPGNSIGTLNVAGNVSFATGSLYQVEINAAGQSDRIVATGAASLNGGDVQVLASSGSYAPSMQYTILTAAGGVSGAFAGVKSDFAFLTPTISYDPNAVVLSLDRNAITFAEVGATPNQQATGGAVEALGAGNQVYNAVVGLNSSDARGAFDMLSGEMHASIKGVMVEDSRFVREAALDRLRAATSGVGASSTPVVTYADGNPVAASATTDRFAAWGRGFGSWGQVDGNGNAATIDRDIGGVLVGADGRVADTWRAGLVGGYSRSTFSVGARNSSAESDDYHVGLYAGTAWGDLAFRSGVAYSWHDVSTERSAAFPGFAEKLNADYWTGTAQVFGEVAYELRAAKAVALEPFANIAYVDLSTDGFTETGGSAALTSRDSGTNTTFSTLGMRASTGFVLGNGANMTAHGMLGWQHAFGDITPTAIMAFAGGSPFDIAGVPISEDVAITEAGLDYNIGSSAVLGFTYNGQFSADTVDQSVRGNLNVNF